LASLQKCHESANPDKFQALAIGKKSMDKNIVLDLAGYKIKCEKEVKLLGVTIDFELKFNSHISPSTKIKHKLN
jgi:hypothetical protein